MHNMNMNMVQCTVQSCNFKKKVYETKLYIHKIIFASFINRAIGRSENPGPVVIWWAYSRLLLVDIGLTDLPKSGDAMALPARTSLI